MVGGAQLPCEAFVLAVVADEPKLGAGDAWHSQLLIVSDGFVVRAKSTVSESEMRGFGRGVVEFMQGRRDEVSLRTESEDLFVQLVRRPRGEVGVFGHLVRDGATGTISSFQSRTDMTSVDTFSDALRAFPHAS